MHRCSVVNLDISLENILTHDEGGKQTLVLTDFGLSERVSDVNVAFFSRCDLLLQTNCHYYHDHDHYYTYHRRGKKYYYAPEYFIEPPPPSLAAFKIDMWAMGIVLFLLSSGESWSFVLSMRG